MMSLGHGRAKLWHDGAFGVADQFIQSTAKMGFPAPTFFAWCAALTEFAAGLLLAIGLFTRPMALFLVINMSVAAFVALLHAPLIASGSGPAKEAAIMYLLPFLLFTVIGAGHFSADAMIRTLDKDGVGTA
jgi:putative oxidoreductase